MNDLEAIARDEDDPDLFPGGVVDLWKRGMKRDARNALLAHMGNERDAARREKQAKYVGLLRLWADETETPSLTQVVGFGTSLFGRAQTTSDGVSIATRWLTLGFVPVWPIDSFVVRDADGATTVLGKTVLPGSARAARFGVVCVVAVLVILAILPTSTSPVVTPQAKFIVYNGFVEPITVDGLASQRLSVDAGSHVELSTAPGAYTLSTTLAGKSEALETVDVQLDDRKRYVYNPGHRAVIFLAPVTWGGKAPSRKPKLLKGPVSTVPKVDYVFTAPPETAGEGDPTEGLVLNAVEMPPIDLAQALLARGRDEQAVKLVESALMRDPSDTRLGQFASGLAFDLDPAEGVALAKSLRDRRPQAIDYHRNYQSLAELAGGPPVDDYQALYDNAPTPDHAYLLGRIHPDDARAEALLREALAGNPKLTRAKIALGWRAIERDAWDEGAQWLDDAAADGAVHAASVADTRARLARLRGTDPTLAFATLPKGRLFDLRHLLRVAADPSREAIAALGQELVSGDPQIDAWNDAWLAFATDDLRGARKALDVTPVPPVQIRLGLSFGATLPEKRAAIEAQVSPRSADALLQWVIARRISEKANKLGKRVSRYQPTLAILVADDAAKRDPVRAAAALAPLTLDQRAAAWYLLSEEVADDAALAKQYRDEADRYAFPGELPRRFQ